MNNFEFNIFNIIVVILWIGLLISDLYTSFNHGKSIIKVKKSRGLTIFWGVALIFWCFFLWFDIRRHICYGDKDIIDNIFSNIFWLEFIVYNAIKSFRSSEIRENGIYESGYFHKWSEIKSYNWVLPNTITFKVKTLFKSNLTCEYIINEEFKPKVEEVIQRNISL